MRDTRLSAADMRVLGSMTYWCGRNEPVCEKSVREIALLANVSRRQSVRSIKRLIGFGHLVPLGNRQRTMGAYELPRLASIIEPADTGQPEAAPRQLKAKARCANCHKMRYQVFRETGWCRDCTNDVKLNRKIDRRIDLKLRKGA